jgi:hypothetical protein
MRSLGLCSTPNSFHGGGDNLGDGLVMEGKARF